MSIWVRPVIASITQVWGQIQGAPWGTRNPDGSGGHPGVDYGCGMGTVIVAASDGVVIVAGQAWDGGFGFHPVCIFHPADNITTLYGHMEEHIVVVGQEVRAGQEVGLADNQGWSDGSHLHFETRPGEQAYGGNPPNFDPDAWLHAHGAYGGTPWSPPGQLTAADRQKIMMLQGLLHVHVDGGWGSQTDKALQTIRWHCLTPPNPANPSTLVAGLQKLWGVGADGIWGHQTDQAYLLWRYCFLNK